ncbi:hypothetical protein F3Y22_tig00112528pilonHSYRG00017 [Hibiscus syriacus]|uniref:RNase H type-1 domain-containing protein n=1 Tax=Hibiscus syriacus TaxID=106335 RepID=A0A6A2XUW7_HIBSY|nr:hypothetical protein F3Y22_tig00112528pilonHSYRG00017 [Hibiscus syriacus]
MLKMNTDGASQGIPGIAGAGGLLRNEKGEWVMGFAAHLGVCTSVAAELYVIRTGLALALAWKYGYSSIVCEVDAKSVLQLIENGNNIHHP